MQCAICARYVVEDMQFARSDLQCEVCGRRYAIFDMQYKCAALWWPFAICSIKYAACGMPYGLCNISYTACRMTYAIWSV